MDPRANRGTPLGPGTLLAGRFVLDDLLDENDHARLWRATDRVLARSVAVHVLPGSDPRAEAVLTAARTSALVSDVRLLRVLDAATENDVVYVVNEWGAGVSLDRLLADGPLPSRRAAWVVREVADAVATAHRHGVAHGRLLPENVLVTEAGSVKVIGFVVAAVLRSTPDFTHRRVTGGEPLDAFEADVVNLGALLYAGLVGRWPGTEGSAVAPAPAEHDRPLRPRQVRAGVPHALDAVCERVLNGDVHSQHSQLVPLHSAHEVYAALSDYIGDGVAGDAVAAPGSRGALDPERTQVLDREGGATGAPASAPPWARRQPPDGAGEDADTEETPAQESPAQQGGPAAVDPEATQAAAPAFLDETTETPRATGAGHRPSARSGDEARSAPTPGPVPPVPPVPARPLFADEGSPVASASPAPSRGRASADQRTGPGASGRRPETWGPDVGPPPAGPGPDEAPPAGRRWLRLAVVLASLLLVGVAVALGLELSGGPGGGPGSGAGPGGSGSPPGSSGTALKISAVSDFDPQGDPPREYPDLAHLATDGRRGTAWHTSTYFDQFPKLKKGVGLLLDLGHPARVGQVRLTLEGQPTSLRILAAPGADSAPTGTEGLRTVASRKGAGTSVDLRLAKPVTTRWLVVWLTSLPRVSGGYEGTVAEVSVRS